MTLISSNLKENIIYKINNIINIEDPDWSNLEFDLKIKIIHNFCNYIKNNNNQFQNSSIKNYIENKQLLQLNTSINIPLKNYRPKKIIEMAGINKQTNSILFEEFRKLFINFNKEFRSKYNSQNKNFCFGNLSKKNYDELIHNYNYNVCMFLNKNISSINPTFLYNNLISGNQHKLLITNSDSLNSKNLKINNINYKNNFFNIEFNNNVSIQLELYLTSVKITSNIPAKYKIYIKNIF